MTKHFRQFLALLATGFILCLLAYAVSQLSPYLGLLCEYIPSADASFIAVSKDDLERESDQIIVGTVTAVRGAQMDAHGLGGSVCMPVTLYTVAIEGKLGGKEETNPKTLVVLDPGGKDVMGNAVGVSSSQPLPRNGERFLAYLRRFDGGRYQLLGGPQALYVLGADGGLGIDEQDASRAAMMFGHPMRYDSSQNALVSLPSEPISLSPRLRTYNVTPHLAISASESFEYRNDGGTDGAASASLSLSERGGWAMFSMPVNVVCDRPNNDCDLGYMGKSVTPSEAYAAQLREYLRTGYVDEGEQTYGAIVGRRLTATKVGAQDLILLNGPDSAVVVQVLGDDAFRALVDDVLKTLRKM